MNTKERDGASIASELNKLLEGDVLFDDISRCLYSTGACIYKIMPLGVVRPKSKRDVIQTVKFAADRGIPITPRGGGSSRCGQSLGPGIILDFTKYMNRILELNLEGSWVRVEPGLLLTSLTKALKGHGKFFPPDPSSADFCTLGGMLANNAKGAHSVKYGPTRDYVLSLEVVLASGEVIVTREIGLDDLAKLANSDPVQFRLCEGVFRLVEANAEPLKDEAPYVTTNNCGYYLWGAVKDGKVDLSQLLVGSEGTLGIITEAKLRVLDLPRSSLMALLQFDSLEKTSEAISEILPLGPSMLEFIESRLLEFARAWNPGLRPYIPEEIEAVLLVEFEGEDEATVLEQMKKAEQRVVQTLGLSRRMVLAYDRENRGALMAIRKASSSILNRIEGPKKPAAFIEDASVHPSHLPEYIRALRLILDRSGVDAAIYGHAGDGNLHVVPFLDLKDPAQVKLMGRIAEEAFEEVWRLKGTISAEHGDGLARTSFIRGQYRNLYQAFKEIKAIFDPKGVLNPGKVVSDEPDTLTKNLRYGPEYRVILTASVFDDEKLRIEIEKCHGCSQCRSYCPVAIETREEEALARAKANLLREVISGELHAKYLASPPLKAIMDLCFNCKLCLTECPTAVDIPGLAIQAKAFYTKANGQSLQSLVLTSTEFTTKLGSLTAPVANFANSFRPLRSVMEASLGIARDRNLPRFYYPRFRQRTKSLKSQGHKEVVYFPGCFANANDPEGEGQASMEVLERNGFRVSIPDHRCCGVAKMTAGSLDSARRDAEKNIEILFPYAIKGIPIIFSAPSCCLAIRHEYPRFFPSEEARLVSEHSYDIHEFLMGLYRNGSLNTDFGEVRATVAYHNPCHLKAQGIVKEPAQLLRLIPGLNVREIEDSCCGIAGCFGMKKQNFHLSMRIGESLFREIDKAGAELALTGCGTCKIQMEQGLGREVFHPMAILAKAYTAKKD